MCWLLGSGDSGSRVKVVLDVGGRDIRRRSRSRSRRRWWSMSMGGGWVSGGWGVKQSLGLDHGC